MKSEDVEGQLEVAMQRFLENYVIIDEEKLKVSGLCPNISFYLECF